MDEKKILQDIDEAEMILVGLGEEFNAVRWLKRRNDSYSQCKDLLEKEGYLWLLPAYQNMKLEEEQDKILLEGGLVRLAERLKGKNYFVVSVATADCIERIPWREDRLVMPCGSSSRKQCCGGCENSLSPITEEEKWRIREILLDMEQTGGINKSRAEHILGYCPQCGRSMALNNVYCTHYEEKGYLEQWEKYKKWLQGSLNHRLLVLELGVGMQFPSVIRWPFEKIAFFNNKAKFYRINEKIYQLTEELKEKGVAISENAIDWLCHL